MGLVSTTFCVPGVSEDEVAAHGLTLIAQCVECIKEHSTRSHIERLDHVAFPANRSRIASASLGARPGLVNRSTAAWLAATSQVERRRHRFNVVHVQHGETSRSHGRDSIAAIDPVSAYLPRMAPSESPRVRLSWPRGSR